MKKEYFSRVRVPVFVTFMFLWCVHALSNCAFSSALGYELNSVLVISDVISAAITTLLFEVMAYITCWAFVLRKDKADNHIWINYLIWTALISITPIQRIIISIG